MAELQPPKLIWPGDTSQLGYRKVDLPEPLPEVDDSFDWQQRDFDSFQQAMWQELQVRFPERKRWTSGDVETVLIDVLAAVLDQLSDMADRVSAEAYLETARRTESVLKWLDFIGYDPIEVRPELGADRGEAMKNLLDLYRNKPHELERDRQRGPASIRRQRRMVSPDDYAEHLREHPLVMRAQTTPRWNGSWLDLYIIVQLWNDWRLDDHLSNDDEAKSDDQQKTVRKLPVRRKNDIINFHLQYKLRMPRRDDDNGTPALLDDQPTIRLLLNDFFRRFRMAGQSIQIQDVIPVGIVIDVCVTVCENYFQSEVRREVERALGRGPTGFFRPGRLAFGQDVQLSDIYQYLMPLDGVENVRLQRFGKERDQPTTFQQTIEMAPDELAVCDNKGHGYFDIQLHGGRRG